MKVLLVEFLVSKSAFFSKKKNKKFGRFIKILHICNPILEV
jgi:hypothetical protein